MRDKRYDGRPLLRVFELFVLDAIGEIRTSDADQLDAMAPKIAASMESSAKTWQGVVLEVLDLPPDFTAWLRTKWAASSDESPEEFARRMADPLVI